MLYNLNLSSLYKIDPNTGDDLQVTSCTRYSITTVQNKESWDCKIHIARNLKLNLSHRKLIVV